MNWVLEHLQLIIGAAAALAYVLNQRRAAAKSDESRPAKQAGDPEHEERTRRIQEEIRRKIAERRGATSDSSSPSRELIPPFVRPTTVPPIDPFGGPMRKVVRKLEEAAARRLEQSDETAREKERTGEVLRQTRLAEQLRELEEARLVQQRRAADIAARNAARVQAQASVNAKGRDVRAMLKDPRQLRRAFILREVLGPPVSSRF